MEFWAKKGVQIWNDERTAGYELTQDVIQNAPFEIHHIKPLGNAPAPVIGQRMPPWFSDVALRKGGLEKYLKRNPQDAGESDEGQ